ncbi:MAG: lamin tail domain-containing protein, partial [Planctomycetales bacterium]|nr:lamin tail domain-containing protein [Planctomycetales bacterium]
DYSQLMAFSKIMGLTGSAFTSQIGDVIDVDQWLRAFAFSVITGHGDNYGADGSQHNLQLYVRPEDGKVLFFPHDLDAFFQTTRALVGNNDLRKMLTVPEWEHMYYGHVHDMIQTTFNEQYMTHWTDLYRELIPSQRFDRHLTELVRRSDYLIGQIERQASPLDFSITTADSSVNTPTVTIAGNGWVNVRELRLAGSDVPLSVEWTDVTAWSTEIPLALGANQIQLEAYDFQGQLIGADAVTVTTSVANPVQDAIRISEINYHPHAPTDQELASVPGLTDESFEFVELVNVSNAPVNLLGVQFSQGVEFVFPSMILGANEVGVIVRNEGAFVARYGDQVRILGQFASGQLSNSGEQLTLVDVAGENITSVDYTETDPWSEAADGVGATLEWTASSGNSSANAKPNQWRSSVSLGGNPGSVDRLASRGIVINEVVSNGSANQPDAIELLNVTNDNINISGWFLSDAGDNLFKFAVPAGTIVPANGYVVFDETDFNADPNSPTSFALGAGGDDVWLTRVDDENNVWFEDHVRFPALDLGQSWGRPAASTERSLPLAGITMGAANSGVALGPVVLSEIAYRPGNPAAAALAIDPTLSSADLQFVELSNASSQAVNLADWELTGTLQHAFDAVMLNAGESIVLLSFDPNDGANAARTAAFRTHYGLSESVRMTGGLDGTVSADSTGGNGLARLWMPMNDNNNRLLLADEAFYDHVAPWPSLTNGSSLQRTNATGNGNDAAHWQASLATPGQHVTTSADFNQDGRIDVADIDLLCAAIQAGDHSLDLNGDSDVSQADMDVLIKGVLRTSYGDVNLDGVFNSNDLVMIFQQGEFEDGIAGNSTWADGDWNCDGEFSTADLVNAFQDGGYVATAKKNRP